MAKETFPEGTAVITEREIRRSNPKKFIITPKKIQPRTFSPKGINFIQRLNPAPALSREQNMLQEMFSGEGFMNGGGSCLPSTDNGNLGTDKFGGGGETGNMFGFKRYNGGY